MDARGSGTVALNARGYDRRGAALAGINTGDGSAPVPATGVAALKRAAYIGVGILHACLAVVANGICRSGLWGHARPPRTSGRKV